MILAMLQESTELRLILIEEKLWGDLMFQNILSFA
jgi:hypothetical protein